MEFSIRIIYFMFFKFRLIPETKALLQKLMDDNGLL